MAIKEPKIEDWPPYARYHWTRQQYERTIDSGIFEPGAKLELIGGEITEKTGPQNCPRSAAIGALQYALEEAFPTGHWIRIQLPLALTDDSEPEPDLAIVTGSWRDYRTAQPTTAVLIVEISDTTLLFDRGVKASLYAKAGIPEYWIVNLRDRILEIHREPSPMADQPFGFYYKNVTRYTAAQIISPLATPSIEIAVSDLLP